jgi:hypothetical protein
MKACAVVLLLAHSASAQVIVDARPAKSDFIAGEPIQVVIDVTNLGDEPVLLQACCLNIRLTVPDAGRRVVPSLSSCHSGILFVVGTGVGSVDHAPPPVPVGPGETFSHRSVLVGYSVAPGTYQLLADGTVYAGHVVAFTHILELVVRAGNPSALEQAFAPYVTDSRSPDIGRRSNAIGAIIEMAPAFLEEFIATQASTNLWALDALTRIGSRDARAHLKSIYAQATDDFLRSPALYGVASLAQRDDFDFLNRVLLDDGANQLARTSAALGLGKIGGDDAVLALVEADARVPVNVRRDITVALGTTKSRLAVSALINRLGQPGSDISETCSALTDLTQYQWCDGSTWDENVLRRRWTRWWKANTRKVRLFSAADVCPNFPELLPQVR